MREIYKAHSALHAWKLNKSSIQGRYISLLLNYPYYSGVYILHVCAYYKQLIEELYRLPWCGLGVEHALACNASSGNRFNTLLISKFAIGVFNVPGTYPSTRHHPSFRSYATDHTVPQYISKAWICWGEDSNPGPLQDHTEYASDLTLVATAPRYINLSQ